MSFAVQSDWESTLSVPGGRAWISCKVSGVPGIHSLLFRFGSKALLLIFKLNKFRISLFASLVHVKFM